MYTVINACNIKFLNICNNENNDLFRISLISKVTMVEKSSLCILNES